MIWYCLVPISNFTQAKATRKWPIVTDVIHSDQTRSVKTSSKVISVMENTQKKGVSHGKASEGSSAQHRSYSPNNDSYEDGYPGDRVPVSQINTVSCLC